MRNQRKLISQETLSVPSHVPPSKWHREDIKAEVRKRGSTLAELAKNAGLAPASLSYALAKRHPRANRTIAEFIRVPLHELWPAFYPPPRPEATPERAPLSHKKGA